MHTEPPESPLDRLGITVFERGWLSSNNILIRGASHAALVDTGYATHAAQTADLVRAALFDCDLDVIANTHLHSDHCGGNAALQAIFPAATTLIPPGQADAVRRWDTNALTYAPTGQQCPRFVFDALLMPGEEIRLGDLSWQVHAADGHDPHSVVLYEPEHRILISADALWANGFGVVFPELEDQGGFAEVQATLELIESLRPRWVIPGHGPVFSDLEAALGRARSRLRQFVERPDKHRRHALKVLIKFKLLEWQQTTHEQLMSWFRSSTYFRTIAAKDSTDSPDDIVDGLLRELESVGALQREGPLISNR